MSSIPELTPVTGGYRVKTVDGWHIDLVPLMRSHRIVERPAARPEHYERYWCYQSAAAAALAAAAWDGSAETEPVGWFNKGGPAKRPTIQS